MPGNSVTTTLEKTEYTAKGSLHVVQPLWGADGIYGYSTVTVKDVATDGNVPWEMGTIDATRGGREQETSTSGEPDQTGRYTYTLALLADYSTLAGTATLSGFGTTADVLGFKKVTITGRNTGQQFSVQGDVSVWQYEGSYLVSTFRQMENIDLTTTITEYGAEATLTVIQGIESYAGDNYTWVRNATGTSFTAKRACVGNVQGYKNVTVNDAMVLDVIGGLYKEQSTATNTYASRHEDIDENSEMAWAYFYVMNTEEHKNIESKTITSDAVGTLKATNGSMLRDVLGYKTVTIQASDVTGDVQGGTYLYAHDFNETLSESGYVLYPNNGRTVDTTTVKKQSSGSITVGKGAIVGGTISGYEKVTITDSTAADIQWALDDDILFYQNGVYVDSSTTVYTGDVREIRNRTTYTYSHGGKITIKNSTANDIREFQTVTITDSQVGNIEQSMQFSYVLAEEYGMYVPHPVYANADNDNSENAESFSAQNALMHRTRNFAYPTIDNHASGKAVLTNSTILGMVSGYEKVTATDCTLSSGIYGGKHTEKEGVVKETLTGSVTLKNSTLYGAISGFKVVQLTDTQAESCSIFCGETSMGGDTGDTSALAGTVTLTSSTLDGTIDNASKITLTSSRVQGILNYADASATMTITLDSSIVDGNVAGTAKWTVKGGVSEIAGNITGDSGKDILTVKSKATLNIGGNLYLAEGKNRIDVKKNALLRIGGDLTVQDNDTLNIDGDVVVLGDASDLWTYGKLTGSGGVYMTTESWGTNTYFLRTSFDGLFYDIGTAEVAQAFQGRKAETADNGQAGAVDLLNWMGDSTEKNGWLCGKENVYYIMNEATYSIEERYVPYPIEWHDFYLWNPRYVTDKEDWYSLNLDDALANGWTNLDFSDNVNVYVFGDRWFTILDGDNMLDIQSMRDAHAGHTNVSICVAVKGTTFAQPGTYSIAVAAAG